MAAYEKPSTNIDSTKRKYVAGFKVHDAKELSSDGTALDPLVVVRCLGREYKTALKTGKVQHSKWEESYIWNDIHISEAEFNMAYMDFELQAANVFFRNDVIGTGKVQLAMVRKRPNHSYSRKQLQLSSNTQLTAKLTVSVWCYGEGDRPPVPEDAEVDQEEVDAHLENINNAIIGQGQNNISQFSQFYQIFVQVHRAEQLGGGEETYNPYVSVEFNGHTLKGPAAKNTHTLAFDDMYRIPVVTPLFADSIVIRVWDKQTWRGEQLIVQGRLSFSLLRMNALPPKWFNFYGFSKSEVTDVQALTGHGEYAEENTYQGRLLISARVNKVPGQSHLQKPDVVKGLPQEEPPSSLQIILCDCFQVSGCAGSEVYVSISLGHKSKKSKEGTRSESSHDDHNQPGRFFFEDDRGRIAPLTAVIPTNHDDQLDVIISLWSRVSSIIADSDFKRIGFLRVKVREIREWRGETGTPQWLAMRPMAHMSSSTEPGSILIALAKSPETVLTRGVPNVKPVKFILRCYVSQARNLSSESSSVPSTFCQISCAGEVKRTKVQAFTKTPHWSELLTLEISLQCQLANLRVYPEPIQMIVYDDIGKDVLEMVTDNLAMTADVLSKTAAAAANGDDGQEALDGAFEQAGRLGELEWDVKKLDVKQISMDYANYVKDLGLGWTGDVLAQKRLGAVVDGRRVIGRAQVHFAKLLHPLMPTKMRPKWIKLQGGSMGTSHTGDIMVGFELTRVKYGERFTPKPLNPPAKPCMVSVSIVGLRNLKLDDDWEIQKPVVQVVVPNISDEATKGKGKGKGKGATKVTDAAPKADDEVVPKTKSKSKDNAAPKSKGKAKATAKAVKGKGAVKGKSKGKGGGKAKGLTPRPNGPEKVTTVVWDKTPQNQLHDRDYNSKWTVNGTQGFEFLTVVHLETMLPKLPVYDPDLRFRLLDGDDLEGVPLAEGRVSLAESLPWVRPEKARKAVEAQAEFSDSEMGDQADGLPVSDADDEGSNYIDVTLGNQPAKIAFNKRDKSMFPPIVTAVAPNSTASEAGVRAGDWLIAVQEPGHEKPSRTHSWNPADASEFIEKSDENKVRPLILQFRRKEKAEVHVRITQGPTDLELVQNKDEHPPKIFKDVSKDKIWRKAGVSTGWRIVDINGVDTTHMTTSHPKLKALMKERPAVFTCRPHGLALKGEGDRTLQESKPVLLSGVATKIQKEREHKMKHKDGAMAFLRVARPHVVLPSVVNTQHLNIRPCRGGLLDVQGVTRYYAGGDVKKEGENMRPSVQGTLEDAMPPPVFRNISLYSGSLEVGHIKARFKVVSPVDQSWMTRKAVCPDDKVFFNEVLLRKRFKLDQPHTMRVRCYVLRGLNISGSSSGYGNPYLYFGYGEDKVSHEGKRFLQDVEPRFFHTEEHDVQFPEQSSFEIGVYDYKEHGEDQLIGKSTIDLEDRFFTRQFKLWMKGGATKMPMEYRAILSEEINPDTGRVNNLSKGSLEMWMEILDTTTAAEVPISKLFEPPSVEIEVRCIIWGVQDLSLRMCTDDLGDPRSPISIRCRCALDCKAFNGSQSSVQETDQHDGSTGEGEFNWRCVFSRLAVTRGVSLDCFLTLSVWEAFTISRPELLCEAMIDVKNYCKQVAQDRVMIEMDSNVPLTNQQLYKLLRAEKMGGPQAYTIEGDIDTPGGDDEDSDSSDGSDDAAAKKGAAASTADIEIPPAGYMKVTLQFFAQTEASSSDNKVGLGRDEPNRDPGLPYPTTGRSWQYTLPAAEAAIVSIIETASTWGKRGRCGCTMLILLIILVILALFPTRAGTTECAGVFRQSCYDMNVCPNCYYCAEIAYRGTDWTEKKKLLCFSIFAPLMGQSADDSCASRSGCNLQVGTTCNSDGELTEDSCLIKQTAIVVGR